MKKWLFNPFVYVAGARSLVIGILAMLATAVIGFYSHTHFDGVIDLHNGRVSPLSYHLLEQLTDWLCMTVIFYAAGKIFSRSAIRIIDIAGTMAMARWVMIFVALIGFTIYSPATAPVTIAEARQIITPRFVLLTLVCLVFAVWMIVLMYNAFRVSCNIKGDVAMGAFIGGLVVAEVLSKVAIYFLYHKI